MPLDVIREPRHCRDQALDTIINGLDLALAHLSQVPVYDREMEFARNKLEQALTRYRQKFEHEQDLRDPDHAMPAEEVHTKDTKYSRPKTSRSPEFQDSDTDDVDVEEQLKP